MTTIKEARSAIEAVLRRLTGTQAEVMEAADAYALAVLEKALMVGSADHVDDYDAGAEALRREIEEPGR